MPFVLIVLTKYFSHFYMKCFLLTRILAIYNDISEIDVCPFCQLTHSSTVLVIFLSLPCHILVNYSFSLQFVSFTQQILSFNKKFSFFTQSFLVLFTTHSQQSYFTKITFHSNSTKISLSHISSKNFLFFFHSHKQNNPFQTKILIHCDSESVLLVFVLFQEWIPHHVVHTPDIVVDHE